MDVYFDLSKTQKLNAFAKDTIIKTIKDQKPETSMELMELVKATTGLSEKEILRLISQLEDEGKIHLNMARASASASKAASFLTSKSAWYLAVVIVAISTVISVFTIPQDEFPLAYIRNVLGVIYVLFLPGYAAVRLLFPAKIPMRWSSEGFEGIESFALSIGLSIAFATIIGLMMYYTPIGLGTAPITLSLLALTLILSSAAWIRDNRAKSVKMQHTFEA